MDIDIILEPDLTPAQVAELAQVAEGFGIRALWSSNYYVHPDAFLTLADAARTTDRMLLGPLALSPFEMHPLKIANAILTLNEMTNGRAIVAIGTGEGLTDAIEAEKPKRLVGAVREAIEIIWGATNGTLNEGYDGEFFRIAHPFVPAWAQSRPPLVYAASIGPQMLRMGARVADGLQMGDMSIPRVGQAIENVRAGLAQREQPNEAFRIGNFFGWHIKADRQAAFREARREIAWRGRKLSDEFISPFLSADECALVRANFQAFVQAWFDRSGDIHGVPESIVNALIGGITSTGDLGDVDREIDRYRKFEQAGLTELALRLHDDPMEGLQIIGERVVPALQS